VSENPQGRAVRTHTQKQRFGLFIRTIGLARAEANLTLANLAYNIDQLVFHERRRLAG
jgi:IS5 family transposase